MDIISTKNEMSKYTARKLFGVTNRFCFCIDKLLTQRMANENIIEKIEVTNATKEAKRIFLSGPINV